MTPINAKNAGYFSELAYQPIGTRLQGPNIPSGSFPGWTEILDFESTVGTEAGNFNLLAEEKSIPGQSEGSDGVLANQFRIFTNGAQFVFAFKGSSALTNWVDDLAHDGAVAYAKLEPVVQLAILAIEGSPEYAASFAAAMASSQVFTDGHSLGGGLAQSIALQDNFNGFGQNSLPISAPASSVIQARGGDTFSNLVTKYESQHKFIETNTAGDIATAYYGSTVGPSYYLDKNPTTIPSLFSVDLPRFRGQFVVFIIFVICIDLTRRSLTARKRGQKLRGDFLIEYAKNRPRIKLQEPRSRSTPGGAIPGISMRRRFCIRDHAASLRA